MKAEIITVGTEILMGYIINSNASWLGQALLDIGIGTYYQQTVGDNADRMKESLELAMSRSHIIIVSGGLGPTRDDITKQMVADVLDKPLILDADQEEKVIQYYEERSYDYGPLDANQAAITQDSTPFFNDVGLACGFAAPFMNDAGEEGVIIVVPGPPFELKEMFNNHIKDYLQVTFLEQDHIDSLYLNFYGLGETMMSKEIDDLIQEQTNPTIALYAKPSRVTIRLTASGEDRATTEQMNREMAETILERLDTYFIGYGEGYTLENAVIEQLSERNESLSLAESLTGGLVMHSLSSVSGASKVLYGGFNTYQTLSKQQLLNISSEILEKYTVVSEEVATAMAEHTRNLTDTDYALALTGVAGPGSLEGHALGEVYIALAIRDQKTQTLHLNIKDKPRKVVQETAKDAAINLLRQEIYQ
ncbi:competence/damage-inducible protein A [Aerococcaceae bacterium DSM 111020]|nr:competence/damage-inducible protein A [Aerococcaceae bacterium DSM 111020]